MTEKITKKRTGGSQNPIVFHDYESFIKKFTEKTKTTDECWTPPDVYDAVLQYVGTVTNLTDRPILRPFFPGGDYEHAEYPENGIVIDNPPFSCFSRIVRFYAERDIPFFLFGPGLTIAQTCDVATAIIINSTMTFSNGAKVRCNFVSNLFGDTIIQTAPELERLIKACPSQDTRVNLPKRIYPRELLSVSDMQTIAGGGLPFSVSRTEAVLVRRLDNLPKIFGNHFIVSEKIGAEKEAAKEATKNAQVITFSERERQIVTTLNRQIKSPRPAVCPPGKNTSKK